MVTRDWSRGDSVFHAGRPEWGIGEVLSTEASVHEGTPCQRLTVRFSRAGTKTLSTAFADIRSSAEAPRLAEESPPENDPFAKAASELSVEQAMLRLPESATDPFLDLSKRFAATLDLYAKADTGAGLLDWAAVQTGLKDPLSRFNRHELEQWFSKFQIELDAHLRRIARDLRRQNQAAYTEIASRAGASAQRALRRVDAGR